MRITFETILRHPAGSGPLIQGRIAQDYTI